DRAAALADLDVELAGVAAAVGVLDGVLDPVLALPTGLRVEPDGAVAAERDAAAGRTLGRHRGHLQLAVAALVVPGQVAGVLPHRLVDAGLPHVVVDRRHRLAGTAGGEILGGRL